MTAEPASSIDERSGLPRRRRAARRDQRFALAHYRMVEQIVARAYSIRFQDLRAPTRCRAPVAFARQVAMYLAHVVCGLSFREVAQMSGRDRTTTAHACRLIEDRRDDPSLDCSLMFFEQVLRSWMSARPAPSPASEAKL